MANEAQKIYHAVAGVVDSGVGLDLGCGAVPISPNATGVDLGEYPGVVNMRVTDFLLKEIVSGRRYDWVFSSHFLEHEPHVNTVLKAIWMILKPGGDLLLYLPDRLVYVDAHGNDPNSGHLHHWVCEEFCELLSVCGHWKIVVAESRDTTPAGHAFTGNGDTEDPRVQGWEYSFFVHARKE